jgi:hypothetical protein
MPSLAVITAGDVMNAADRYNPSTNIEARSEPVVQQPAGP